MVRMKPRSYIARMARATVVVHLKVGHSVRGVLTAVHRDALVLSRASALAPGSAVPIDGDAVIPRVNVAWLQELPAPIEE